MKPQPMQLDLAYRPAFVAREAWSVQVEAIRAAVEHLTRKEVAHELDIAPSYLSDALNERDHKYWRAEWSLVVLAMLEQQRSETADAIAHRILECMTALSPYVLEQRLELDAEAVLADIARTEQGRELIARAQRKGRKR